jgi:WD40 repeat protein
MKPTRFYPLIILALLVGLLAACTSAPAGTGETPTAAAPALTPTPAATATATPPPFEPGQEISRTGRGIINSASLSPDGRLLAVAGIDGVYIYDAASLEPVKFLDMGGKATGLIVFAPDSQTLGVAGSKALYLWNVENGVLLKEVAAPNYINTLAFNPDGSKVALGLWDGTIYMGDVASDAPLNILDGHTGQIVVAVAFSPDGTLLASGAGDAQLCLWDVASGQLRRTIKGHQFAVQSIAFSPDGKKLATGSLDEFVRVWNAASGALLTTLEGSSSYSTQKDLAFISGGERLVSNGGSNGFVYTWDANNGELLSTHTIPGLVSLMFAPDGKTFYARTDDEVDLCAAESGEIIKSIKDFSARVYDLALSPDGNTLAVVSGEDPLKLWKVEYNQLTLLSEIIQTDLWDEKMPADLYAVAFSPDGKTLAGGDLAGNLYLWDAASGVLLNSLKGEMGQVFDIDFSPDGKQVAYGVNDGGMMPTGAVRLWDPFSDAPPRKFQITGGTPPAFGFAVAFSPDGARLASILDGRVVIWDVASGNTLHTLEEPLGNSSKIVAFSPDGKLLAAISENKAILLWDAASGKLQRTLEWESHYFNTLAFSPDGALLAAGGSRKISLIDLASGEQLAEMKSGASRLVFAFSGDELISGSSDGVIRQWQIAGVKPAQ